jgi:hypothetical protein
MKWRWSMKAKDGGCEERRISLRSMRIMDTMRQIE